MTVTTRRTGFGASFLVAALVGAFAAGAILVVGLGAVTRPSAEADGGPRSLPATVVEFDDVRMVNGTPVAAAPVELIVHAAGTVTSSRCRSGEVIDAESAPLAVDGEPILAVATSSPPWRDLVIGDRGDDVDDLQQELARLGNDVEPTGVLDAATVAAVDALLGEAGGSLEGAAVPRDVLLWLPETSVTIADCAIQPGALVQPGTAIATTVAGLESLQVTLPGDLVDGARELTFGDARLALDLDEPARQVAVTDADLLAQVESSEEYQLLLGGVTSSPLSMTLRLAEPIELVSVAPGALSMVDASTGCLFFGGQTHTVDVVASQLGQTMVRLPEGVQVPTEVSAADADAPWSCE